MDEFLAQSFHWPLLNTEHLLPDNPGLFGSVRKEDIHTGIDLYCEIGTVAVAMCSGIVVGVENFTGKYVGNKTRTSDQYYDGFLSSYRRVYLLASLTKTQDLL